MMLAGKRFLDFFRFLAISFCFWPLGAHAAVFHPETYTLANGLQIVIVKNRLSPAVAQMVWYKVGAADEAPGKSGLAHYLEHLMFRGTEQIPAGAFSPLIAAQGGNDNAFTGHDATAYHEVIAAGRLAMVMQMEADRMQNLVLTPETAIPELQVVLSERQERTDNSPEGLFAEKVRYALFPNHPYGRPVIGWQNELAQITPEEARAFYKQYYAPNNAILTISGDVETAEVLRLAAATFGRLPAQDIPPRHAFPPPALPQEKRVILKDPRVKQPHFEIHILAPSYMTQKNHEAYALEVLGEALGGGEVGLLYRQLVVKEKIASAVEASYSADARGPALFSFAATPQPGRSIDELERSLRNAVRRLAQKGLDAKTIKAAQTRLERAAVFARDSLTAAPRVFGTALTTGETVADVEAWPDRIRAVSPDAVNAAFRTLLADKHQVTGLLLTEEEGASK